MTLYEFYGDGCPHCKAMEDKVQEIQDEEEAEIEQLEVWNNQENAEKQQELDDGKCGGVPFFYNTDSDEWICGETDKETLVTWVNGDKVN
jgi:thiol-disulfide isomerase/thioredoxin